MNAWLKRNRWALITLVVLIPAAIVAAMSISFFRYFGDRSQQPPVVAEGDAGEYVPDRPSPDDPDALDPDPAPPAHISLKSYTVVPWDTDTGREVGLTEGSEAISALIHVDATDEPEDVFGCDAIVTAPSPDGEIVWTIAGSPDIDYYPTGDLHGFCDLGSGEEFDWEAVFVVPEGMGDSVALYITDGSVLPVRVLQLAH